MQPKIQKYERVASSKGIARDNPQYPHSLASKEWISDGKCGVQGEWRLSIGDNVTIWSAWDGVSSEQRSGARKSTRSTQRSTED